MKQNETVCPLFFAALLQSPRIRLTKESVGLMQCSPGKCMWAMRKTAMGEDGKYHTVGYRCAVATGSDRYVEVDE